MPKQQNLLNELVHGLQKPIAFEPVMAEDDELIQAIESDDQTHDNLWQLNENPDGEKLDEFWTNVLTDWNKDD